MDVLLNFAVLMIPSVISGLQTCSSGAETSSDEIMLEVSSKPISKVGGMCSCRVTVAQTTQVYMTTPFWWIPFCEAYMTIQKWGTGSHCINRTNFVTPPPQTHTVTPCEEIWIQVVVDTNPTYGMGIVGQIRFNVKQSSDQLNIECFEPNTICRKTTTPSSTSASTNPSTSKTNVVKNTFPTPTTTRRITSTAQPTTQTETSTFKPTTHTETSTFKPTTHTETSTFKSITHTQTLRSPDTTPQAQPVSPPASTTRTRTTIASTPQNLRTGSLICCDNFPGGVFAAGVATGVVLVHIAGGLYMVISRRKWWTSRRQKSVDIPISEAHPTYSGFISRTESVNTYDKIGPNYSKGTDNPYINES